jgi:outer membrane biosynthesis protein TonB
MSLATLSLLWRCRGEPSQPQVSAAFPTPQPIASLSPTATPVVYRITGAVTPPRLLSRMEIPVPESCRKGRQFEGSVFIYEATITEAGEVQDIKTLKAPRIDPPCPELEEGARRAISQWRYQPGMLKGQPVRVYLTVTQLLEFR